MLLDRDGDKSLAFTMPTTTRAHALFVKLRCFGLKCPQNEGSARSRELSLPLDPYATATDWISPLSFRNFRANPAALRFAAGRDMLQNCSTVAPKVQSFACAWGVNRSRQFTPSAMLFFRIKYTTAARRHREGERFNICVVNFDEK